MVPLINCEINPFSTWSEDRSLILAILTIKYQNLKLLYVPVVTLSTQENVKLLDKVN